jgi:hypothetical protein
VIVLRVILGGVLGFFLGTIIFGLIVIGVGAARGYDTKDMAISFAPFGGLLGMSIGATWQILKSDKKR